MLETRKIVMAVLHWKQGLLRDKFLHFFHSTFCMLDEDETCLPVNVYNIAQGTGVKIGDSVAIPEPYIQHVNVNHKGKVRLGCRFVF